MSFVYYHLLLGHNVFLFLLLLPFMGQVAQSV